MDIRELFGRNVRRARRRMGISQAALAVKVGVDRAHISLMERGLQNVTLLTLWQVSEALSVEPSELLQR
jgi:transcriptional regulator with XRE-family HTH domain